MEKTMLRRGIIISIFLVILVIVILAGIILGQRLGQGGSSATTPTPAATTYTATGMLHVEGTQLIDASGHPVLLHGAQIESPFNYIKRWEQGQQPSTQLNSRVFEIMAHDWKMNVLRLPTSNWIYAKYPTDYLNKLDQVVQQAYTWCLICMTQVKVDHPMVKMPLCQKPKMLATGKPLPPTTKIIQWSCLMYTTNRNITIGILGCMEVGRSMEQWWLVCRI